MKHIISWWSSRKRREGKKDIVNHPTVTSLDAYPLTNMGASLEGAEIITHLKGGAEIITRLAPPFK